jgi:hypothetical protein
MSSYPALNPAGPRDCALGMAIPLKVEAFAHDLAAAVDKDFAKHFVRMNTPSRPVSDNFYELAFKAVADGMERACSAVEKRGVKVARCLTLLDLPGLFAQAKVVTIFAHWRFVSIREDDIIDPEAILKQLRSPDEEVHRLVREEALRRQFDLFESDRACLATLLNDIAAAANATYLHSREHDDVFEVMPGEAILHRVTFESAFEGSIRPGRCIELFDGMHTVWEFIEAIPSAFEGLLDLTVCHSMVLGRAVKKMRPRCVVALSRRPVDLRVKIALYEIAVRMIRCRPQPFMSVLSQIATRPRYIGGAND